MKEEDEYKELASRNRTEKVEIEGKGIKEKRENRKSENGNRNSR